MKPTKDNLKSLLKEYMLENNIGYMSIEASMSMDKSKVIMAITDEEEEDYNDLFNITPYEA